ncbi:MAG: hypothetical protein RBT25_09865 [Lentisphaeria bacterium]|nr:hypothetical protein [Lentisphaeria bacterium]
MRIISFDLTFWRRLTLGILFLTTLVQAQLIWFDGSVDENSEPPGKLLSDNEDYFGETVFTGVDYQYSTEPDRPADNRPSRTGQMQRVLLNGRRGKGVGLTKGRPLQITFDFKRECLFNEIDVVSPPQKASILLELSENGVDAWRRLAQLSRDECPEAELQRFKLPDRPQGRFLRLTMQAQKTTLLDEVLVWGDALGLSETPEIFEPVAKGEYPIGVTYPGITGIGKTVVSDREAFYWMRSLRAEQKAQAAVWFQVSTWDSISHQPLLPKPDEIGRRLRVTMPRNATENLALALKNTTVSKPVEIKILNPAVHALEGNVAVATLPTCRIGVMGVIGDRGFGNNLVPIFYEGNMLGNSLMEKYILNGRQIRDFPKVTLHPSSAAVFWLSFNSGDAPAGLYEASIAIEGGEPQIVEIEVLDLLVPETFALVKTYSNNLTTMFPFVHADRVRKDLEYALDCGISDFSRLDFKYAPTLVELAKQRDMKVLYGSSLRLIPSIYVHNIYCGIWTKPEDFPENAAQEVAATVEKCVEQMRAQGLDYADWYGGTGDEPGHKNMAAVAYVCKLIHQADPKVNIYVNPCYWTGYDQGGVAEDEVVAGDLEDWYAKEVNISMPLFLLLQDRPKSFAAFTAERFINAFYYVSGQLDRSEQAAEVQKYRRMAWDSISMGMNGWAFYSYFSPRGNAWNHFDRNPKGEGLQEPSDYSIVYPGYRGVIPTRQSEALRQGKQDWNLLNLLREQGKHRALADLLNEYKRGVDLSELRIKALRYALQD